MSDEAWCRSAEEINWVLNYTGQIEGLNKTLTVANKIFGQ